MDELAAGTSNGIASGNQADGAVAPNDPNAQTTTSIAPLVPESDTYLLLAAALGTLLVVTWRTRTMTKKA
jgi:hypothetical protein